MKNSKSTKRGLAALALVLAGGIAAGGTLAYLSDTAGTVKNTFTANAGLVEDDDNDFLLNEQPVKQENGFWVFDTEEDGSEKDRVLGNAYSKILPGTTLDKDPKVSIDNILEDSFLYVIVEDTLDTQLTKTFNTDEWKVLVTSGNKTLYVYAKKAGTTQTATRLTSADTDDVKDDEGKVTEYKSFSSYLFEDNKISVPSNFESVADLGSLNFNAYLVQADGWKGNDDDTRAVSAWNDVFGDGTGITVAG